MAKDIDSSSFRDKSGYVFYKQKNVFRSIDKSYAEIFTEIEKTGLLEQLVNTGKLVGYKHVSSSEFHSLSEDEKTIIELKKIPVISYPYEWSFSQLKNASLLTLEIQLESLKKNFSLKDASVFNVQYIGVQPVFIDHLSLEKYSENTPWIAYRQFCEHFLAPLCIYKENYSDLTKLMQIHINGIPLKLASSLMPLKTYFNLFYSIHLHFHSRLLGKEQKQLNVGRDLRFSKAKMISIIQHLKSGIEGLKQKNRKSIWSNYYQELSYSDSDFSTKKNTVDTWLKKIKPKTVLDLGCNTGVFSFIAANHSELTVSTDFDINTIENLFLETSRKGIKNILPLSFDVTMPTPAIGWDNSERKSFWERVKPDTILALAIIHHLAIANNLPLEKLSVFFADKTKWLIIEFVEKNDVQIKKMLANRIDIFDSYTEANFKTIFSKQFTIHDIIKVPGSTRSLYLMERKEK